MTKQLKDQNQLNNKSKPLEEGKEGNPKANFRRMKGPCRHEAEATDAVTMGFEHKRDRIEATAALHLDREENWAYPKHVARVEMREKKNRRKQQNEAYLSLSPSRMAVEVRGGHRCETNLWRKYDRAVIFLYFRVKRSLPAARVCTPDEFCVLISKKPYASSGDPVVSVGLAWLRYRSEDTDNGFSSFPSPVLSRFFASSITFGDDVVVLKASFALLRVERGMFCSA
jgi:hypothetical protein